MKKYEPIPKHTEDLSRQVVDAAYRVHKSLGPGLLERVYEACFCHELSKKGIFYSRQVDIPIIYDGITFNEAFRMDVLVENSIICEIKSVDEVNKVWEAQVLSPLKLTGKRLGFLINFNVIKIRDGIRRFRI